MGTVGLPLLFYPKKRGSIISVVGNSTAGIIELFLFSKKAHMIYNEKRSNLIRKNHRDTLNLSTKLLGITGTNTKNNDIVELDTHKKIISRLHSTIFKKQPRPLS
ncbi:hypothetical protein, partial [Streptococcus sp. DD10]|uniref:hypothetical protein n=1 Tax=Streptococcus sp. DD10 TaxID=1777878 RepID=UPI001E3A2493